MATFLIVTDFGVVPDPCRLARQVKEFARLARRTIRTSPTLSTPAGLPVR
jgi:hypothetical protein